MLLFLFLFFFVSIINGQFNVILSSKISKTKPSAWRRSV